MLTSVCVCSVCEKFNTDYFADYSYYNDQPITYSFNLANYFQLYILVSD